jgi:hypothetical protein
VFTVLVNQIALNIPIVGLLVLGIMSLTKPLRKHQLRVQLGPVPPAKLLKALEKRYLLRDDQTRYLERHPPTDDTQLDLSICEEWIGDALLQLGRSEQALAHIQEARAIRERLAAADPGNAEKRRVLELIKNRESEAQARIGQEPRTAPGNPSPAEIDRAIEGAKRPYAERVQALWEEQQRGEAGFKDASSFK